MDALGSAWQSSKEADSRSIRAAAMTESASRMIQRDEAAAPDRMKNQVVNEKPGFAVPFNQVQLIGSEFRYMQESLAAVHISGDGPFTKKCHALLEKELGAPKVLLTTSCTHALEMSAMLFDLKPGDEVILPSFTFPSTANSFVLRGAVPVFADIREDTCNIDETKLEALITPRTRAIVVVHYAGVSCAMDEIMAISALHDIPVIEDNAHGLFGRYKGKPLGTFGALAAQSFHESKNIICGEGGALVINDPDLVEHAEIIREKGTNRARFFRGQVDKYSWVDAGSSYLPSDLLAAFLYAQLEAREQIQAQRKAVWQRYWEALAPFQDAVGFCLPTVPPECEQSYHMFYLLMRDLNHRQALITHLRDQGINSTFHYVPLHSSAAGLKFSKTRASCPVTEEVSDRLIRLPFYTTLDWQRQSLVVQAIAEFVHT